MEIGKCFNKGPPLKTAEAENSVRFNADKTMDTYTNKACTGTSTTVSLAMLDTCAGRALCKKYNFLLAQLGST